ncbi:hypothetical protein CIB84_010240 [Bambusicola thoracicus]|uniref:SPRY domain-containing protein n=1 Tax=Bambusicola thoracicus TaxID=9083 RepID=A0A2P4SPG7_BAMTH|nr:hypothetical protein CIB84_010240 [Bambusicola thoracicus]
MAASVFCCLRWCRDGGAGHIPLKEMPAVQLDTQRMGTDVVIVKNGRRICGTGGCLANAPLHQNKSYFEFKIQSTDLQCKTAEVNGMWKHYASANAISSISIEGTPDLPVFQYWK